MTKIEYNGSVVATVEGGNTATLPIKDLKMKSDIVVTVPEDKATPIEVSTEAEMTALLESGEVGGVYKYTGTSGTYENGALYVLEEETASLITFTIDGTSYQAEDGMTWAEWCESVYNTDGYRIASYNTYVLHPDNNAESTGDAVALNNIHVNKTEVIQAVEYSLKSFGGSGN